MGAFRELIESVLLHEDVVFSEECVAVDGDDLGGNSIDFFGEKWPKKRPESQICENLFYWKAFQ